jgi:hypothetical protein
MGKTKKMHLKTKDGETISIVEGLGIGEAIKFFSEVKKLSEENLLKIYKIEEEK